MGGIGSGIRGYRSGKDTTEDLLSIDIRLWKRGGWLAPNKSFKWRWSRGRKEIGSIRVQVANDHIMLTYRHKNGRHPWSDMSYPVYIEWTSCHLGGKRPWFICPKAGCGKRVAILYVRETFACRDCHNLAYECQRESPDDRAARRADRIREKLRWEPGILNESGIRPKGMHRTTFRRLAKRESLFYRLAIAEFCLKFNVTKTQLSGWSQRNLELDDDL